MDVYLVESELPELTPDFIQMLPRHRRALDRLLAEGKILLYAVHEDKKKLWCTIRAEDEFQAMEILGELPIVRFLKPVIYGLMIYNGSERVLPGISLN